MKTLKRAILAVIALACAAQVQAQTTNLVQNLSIQLFGYSQGGVSTFGSIVETNLNFVRVDTHQIIQALGAATLNSFSSGAKLVLVTPVDGGNSFVQVRDGNNQPVDVSQFFVVQNLSGSLNNSVVNTRNGRGTSVSYQVTRFALQDDGDQTLNLHFDVNGISTSSSTSSSGSPNSTVNANVSGSGDRNGDLMILQGSVNIFGRTLEVDDGGFTGVS